MHIAGIIEKINKCCLAENTNGRGELEQKKKKNYAQNVEISIEIGKSKNISKNTWFALRVLCKTYKQLIGSLISSSSIYFLHFATKRDVC